MKNTVTSSNMQQSNEALRKFSWTLISTIIFFISISWAVGSKATFSSAIFSQIIYCIYLFIAIAFTLKAINRHFLDNGRIGILAMGCGVILLAIGIALIPIVERYEVGFGHTIYTISVLFFSIFNFIGTRCLNSSVFSDNKRALYCIYISIICIYSIFCWYLVVAGIEPIFINGKGSQSVRYFLMYISIFLTINSITHLKELGLSKYFLVNWYIYGLAFFLVGIAGSISMISVDSIQHWSVKIADIASIICLYIATNKNDVNFTDNYPVIYRKKIKLKAIFIKILSDKTIYSYFLILLFITLSVFSKLFFAEIIGKYLPIYITYYPSVVVSSLILGINYGIVAIIISCLTSAYFFMEPIGNIQISSYSDRFEVIYFVSISVAILYFIELYLKSRKIIQEYDRELALKESYRMLKTFSESTFEGIVESENGMIIDCNDQFTQFVGFSREEIIGKKFIDMIPLEDIRLIGGKIELNVESISEHSMIRKDGSRIYVETHGMPVGQNNTRRHTSIRDVTDRRLYENALLKSRDEWRRTFDAIPDLITILDKDQRIVRTNKAMAKKIGISPEEIEGASCYPYFQKLKLNHPSYPGSISQKDGKSQFKQLKGSDMEGDYLVTTTPIHNDVGEIIGSVHIAHDIAEQKKYEESLKQLNRTLQALTHSSEAMIRASSEKEYLDEVCRIIVEDCGHDMAWIGYAENDLEENIQPVAKAGSGSFYLETLNITWADEDLGRGPTGVAVRTGQASTCRDIRNDPFFLPWRESALKRGFLSAIALPLKSEEKTFGAITIYSNQLDPFTEDEVRLLSELADNLSYGIAALRLQTEREKAEEAIRDSRSLLNMTQQLAQIGGWQYEIESKRMSWTDELYRIYGMDPKNCDWKDYRKIWGLIKPTYREQIKNAFKTLITKGIPYDLELGLVSANGRHVWVRTMGKPEYRKNKLIKCIGNVIDITEIHEAKLMIQKINHDLEERVERRTTELININDELKKSEYKFRSFYNTNPEGIVIIDLDYRIIDANIAFEKNSSYSIDDIHGMSIINYVPSEYKNILINYLLSIVSGNNDNKTLKISYLTKDNTCIPVSIKGWLISENEVKQKYIGIFIRDLTNVKKLAAERNSLQKQIIQCRA